MGRKFDPRDGRLEDIRAFLDNLCGLYSMSKERGEFYFSKTHYKAVLLYYAIVAYYQEDYTQGDHIINKMLLPMDLTAEERNVIKDLRNEEKKDRIKRGFLKSFRGFR